MKFLEFLWAQNFYRYSGKSTQKMLSVSPLWVFRKAQNKCDECDAARVH